MSQHNTHKKDFPIFKRLVHGKPLVYLDNASTTQKPRQVIDALVTYYETHNANIHRGIHLLSEESTQAYEAVRTKVATYIHARPEEIIFTKGTTEGLNLIATTYGDTHIKKGDEILVSAMEHHANLIPWQELARRKKAKLCVIPLTKEYELDMGAYERLVGPRTKLVCVTAQSNVLGTVNPIKKIVQIAHRVGAVVIVDAAQSIGHSPTNVHALACDFLVFSSHKMLGPTGVGVLYGRRELLLDMAPYQFGGDMVTTVSQATASYREAPWRFEAGTPPIADVIALGAAIDYLSKIGLETIMTHDADLTVYAREVFSSYKHVRLFLSPSSRGIVSFTVDGVHPHDIATIFDQEGVAIRSGLHCAEPLVKSLGVSATARMSFYLYTTREDIDTAARALEKVLHIFQIKD